MKLCDYSLGPGGSSEGGAEEGGWGGMQLPSCQAFFFSRGVRCVAEEEKNAPSDEGPPPPPPLTPF